MADFEVGLLVDLGLTTLTDGKPFEALRDGNFTDMRGNGLVVPPERLGELVKNTNDYIAQGSKDGNGSPVGLPIDIRKHENGDAAGWIMAAALSAKGIVELVPKWTELGLEAVGKGIQRLFSATVDPVKWRIVGGSLTNWPAVKGLRAVELQECADPGHPGMYDLGMMPDESTDEYDNRVRRAFNEAYPETVDPNSGRSVYYWTQRVYSDYLVCSKNGQLYRVGLTQKKGAISFAPESEWPKVRMVPVEMAVDPLGYVYKTETELAQEDSMPTLEEIMAEVKKEQDASEKRILAALQKGGNGSSTEATDATPGSNDALLASLGLAGMPAELQAKVTELMDEQFKQFQANAEATVKARMAELTEATRLSGVVANLTQKGIGGKALPIQADRLTRFLSALPAANRKEAEAIFGDILQTSLVDLEEIGTTGAGADKTKKPQLPPELAEFLNKGTITVADLNSGEIAPLLNGRKPEEFDLSAWAAK